ncbi:MAG: hypothetical protein FH749_06940 [Firmicutes bacterium]|nr:hypothetical protein [Bacillota bacterium]
MNRLQSLEQKTRQLRTKHDQLKGRKEALEEQLNAARQELTSAEADIADWEQVQTLFGKVSEFAREQLKARVEQTVTAALQAIFEDSRLEFRIQLKTVANKPAAEWQVISQYNAPGGDELAGPITVTANPEDARGGGITDVVSLALRLALLELARPKPEGPVILDEAGKHVSREFAPNVAEFLKQYAQRTGRQIILITHQEALADVADVAYRVEQKDGVSEVARV